MTHAFTADLVDLFNSIRNALGRDSQSETQRQKDDSETVTIDEDEVPVHQIDQHEGRVILSVDVSTAVEQGFNFSSIWRHKQVDVSMDDRDFRATIDMCSVEHGFAAIGLVPEEEG